MSNQDLYNQHQADVTAAGAAYLDTLKSAYNALKANGAEQSKIAKCKGLYKALANVSNAICDAMNEGAGTVQGVAAASGGGPKNDDDPDNNP